MDLRNVLVIDIETISAYRDYDLLPERLQKQWDKKCLMLKNDEGLSIREMFFQKAAIYAEFGKVITIGAGIFHYNEHKELSFKVKAFAHEDERVLLQDFVGLLEKYDPAELRLCAHNGKEFDFPYLCRRLLIHGHALPQALAIHNKKPWEVLHIDTMDLWKFGDWKSYTSLELLASVFDIDSSKDGIDGSMVNHTYYVDNDLDKIAHYCKMDVVVTAQLLLKLHALPAIDSSRIEVL